MQRSKEAKEVRMRKELLESSRKPEKMNEVYYTRFESPVGGLFLAGDAKALRRASFENGKRSVPPETCWKLNRAPFAEVIRQLQAYFRGELKEFDVPLAMEGTEFQLRVWNALRAIRYGETISYAQLAERIGTPQAVRAVGLAKARNPIPCTVPCQRVIGSDGSRTGFGGGLSTKKKLLE